MTYQPQPGTTPFRAVAWLRSMAKCRPGYEPSTAELCDGIGVEVPGFTAYMRICREQGIVHTRPATFGKSLHWRLGDGKPDPALGTDWSARRKDEPLHLIVPAPRHGPLLPAAAPPPSFRALEWDGHVLATGMTIKDGVAIFTPEQVLALKRTTEQMQPA